MGAPSTGKLADPAWRAERARKGGLARTTLEAHIRAIADRAGRLTPEQIETLRSLLPDPGDGQPVVLADRPKT